MGEGPAPIEAVRQSATPARDSDAGPGAEASQELDAGVGVDAEVVGGGVEPVGGESPGDQVAPPAVETTPAASKAPGWVTVNDAPAEAAALEVGGSRSAPIGKKASKKQAAAATRSPPKTRRFVATMQAEGVPRDLLD